MIRSTIVSKTGIPLSRCACVDEVNSLRWHAYLLQRCHRHPYRASRRTRRCLLRAAVDKPGRKPSRNVAVTRVRLRKQLLEQCGYDIWVSSTEFFFRGRKGGGTLLCRHDVFRPYGLLRAGVCFATPNFTKAWLAQEYAICSAGSCLRGACWATFV